VSGESDYDTTQADLSGMNLPENDHFTATSGNATEDNIKIYLRKLRCKEKMLAKEAEDKFNIYVSVYCKYIYIYPKRCNFTHFIYVSKLFYIFRVVYTPIMWSAYNCIYSIWYFSLCYCYLPL
jgi:hypothetical protein